MKKEYLLKKVMTKLSSKNKSEESNLKKFILKHFDVNKNEMHFLDKAVSEMLEEHDLEGMSEYEMVDIFDDKLYKLMHKHPDKV